MFRTRRVFWLLLVVPAAVVLSLVNFGARAEEQTAPPHSPVRVSAPQDEAVTRAGVPGQVAKSGTLTMRDLPEVAAEYPARYKKVRGSVRDAEGREQAAARQAAAGNLKVADPLASVPRPAAGVPAPAPTASFLGLDQDPARLIIPPDPGGAVGPNHVMTATNERIRIQSKTGTTLITRSLDGTGGFWSTMFPTVTNTVFNPRIAYDPSGQRWITSARARDNQPDACVLIAVSATTDPTGQWFMFLVDVSQPGTQWADFPTLGFNNTWLTLSVNMVSTASGDVVATQIYAFDKAAMYANTGGGAHRVFLNASTLASSVAPAVTYDPAQATQYLVQRSSSAGGVLKLFTIAGPVATPTLTETNITVTSPIGWGNFGGDGFDFAQQAGAGSRIGASLDSRMQSVVYRNGSLWCAHTVFYPATGGFTLRSAVQWWEINQITSNSANLRQRGVIDDPTGNAFYDYPSISVNAANDVLIGYSRFSATQFASANYAFRAAGDPLNTLREDAIMKAGEGPYYQVYDATGNRWGSYSATVVDPSNDLDMWTLQEYAAPPDNAASVPGRWSTWWAKVGADGSAAPQAAPPQTTPTATPTPPVPPNDNFASAQTITGCTGFTTGQNYLATVENGEPSHFPSNNLGGKSVWYTWTAPATGTATFTTDGSTFDTGLAVYTGNGVSALNAIVKDDDSGDSLSSEVTFPTVSGTVYRIAVDGALYSDNIVRTGEIVLNWSLQGVGCTPSTTIQFNRAAYSTLESTGVAVLTLTRLGNRNLTSTVDYSTIDTFAPFTGCEVAAASADQRCDYTNSSGTVTFAPNEMTKTIAIPVTQDAYVEQTENLTLNLSNPFNASLGAVNSTMLRIVDDDTPGSPTNPINTARFFVRQQYADFLSREPDQAGYDFWTGQLTPFMDPTLYVRRYQVSGAFFFELEYQRTGSYVYRMYRAAYGNQQPFPNPQGDNDGHPYCQANPNNCQLIRAAHVPAYEKFTADRARVVGSADLAASQLAFANAFVQRNEFTTKYPASLSTGAQFVDAALATLTSIGVDLSSQRAALIAQYDAAGGGNAGRGRVMYRLCDDNAANPIINTAFINSEYNRAFVTTQYFGYLRRDADLPGLNFWLGIINRFPPRTIPSQEAMVCAFINSVEYQTRFSPLTPRNDAGCPPPP